jgi:hypothetical protein
VKLFVERVIEGLFYDSLGYESNSADHLCDMFLV